MNPRTAFFFQGVLEAAIPVYGYFQWNWDLSFILLFYLIDWILSLFLVGFKGRKRFQFSKDEKEFSLFVRKLVFSILIAGCASLFFAQGTLNVQPEISWSQRIVDFILYKDMGIQQGFILVPLIVLNGIILFKQQFVAPKLFEKLQMNEIIQPALNQNLLLLAFGGAFFGLTNLVTISETVIVFAIIATITAYRMIFVRSVISYGSR